MPWYVAREMLHACVLSRKAKPLRLHLVFGNAAFKVLGAHAYARDVSRDCIGLLHLRRCACCCALITYASLTARAAALVYPTQLLLCYSLCLLLRG